MTGPLTTYTRAAERAAATIIGCYSTSFGLATRLLGRRHRGHVRNIYAMVRLADELVDGVASAAGLTPAQQLASLDRLERDTLAAVSTGFSENLVLHAFASTARPARIEEELITSFFSAMRTDLRSGLQADLHTGLQADLQGESRQQHFSRTEHDAYVYGSAEVVGLMCLRVFLREEAPDPEELRSLQDGARRLGRAFQDINFLRDLADDTDRLGRDYLGVGQRITAAEQAEWVDAIRADLAAARAVIPRLPRDARAAVGAASALFGELADRLAAVPAPELYRRRVRVPDARKALLASRAVLRGGRP